MNRFTLGAEALTKALRTQAPSCEHWGVVFYRDGSGHLVKRISGDIDKTLFSFRSPAELWAWLHSIPEERTAMDEAAKARRAAMRADIDQALWELTNPETIQ